MLDLNSCCYTTAVRANLRLDGSMVLEEAEGEAAPHIELDLLEDHRVLVLQQPLRLAQQRLRYAPTIGTCSAGRSASVAEDSGR